MTTTPPPAPLPPPPARVTDAERRGNPVRRFLLVLLLLAAAFLGGFIPKWIEARNLRAEVRTMDLQLRLANAHRLLGVATEEAHRSNYASAAQNAAQFFDQCAAMIQTESFENEPRTRVALLSYTAQRDQVMTLLSTADPAARERLSGMFLTMNGVLGRREV